MYIQSVFLQQSGAVQPAQYCLSVSVSARIQLGLYFPEFYTFFS